MILCWRPCPVIPTDHLESTHAPANQAVQDLIAQALHDRPELAESDIDLVNRQISNKAAKNALFAIALAGGILWRVGLAGPLNPVYNIPGIPNSSTVPTDFSGAIENAFNNTRSRLLHRTESEHSTPQSRSQGRPIPFRVGIPPSRTAPGTIEKTNPHRSSQCSVRSGTNGVSCRCRRQSQRPGAAHLRNHAKGADARGGFRLTRP